MSNSAKSAEAPPLFRQIVNDLKGRIIDGELQEHMALPSERTVAEQHNVSRMTARRALEAVEAEGLAYSQDRKGRFVSPKRLEYDVGSMANFISGAVAKGIDIEMKLLESNQLAAPEKLADVLCVPAGMPVYQNIRLFSRDGHATFLETETVVAARCAELVQNGASAEPATLQTQRYSPLGHTADIVIRMRALDPDEAELLGVMPYQAGIEQEQTVRDEAGVAFCFVRQIWRGELAQFSARAILNPA